MSPTLSALLRDSTDLRFKVIKKYIMSKLFTSPIASSVEDGLSEEGK